MYHYYTILDNIGTDPWTIRRNSQRLPSYRYIENPIQKFVVNIYQSLVAYKWLVP